MDLYIERKVDQDLKSQIAAGAWVEIIGPQRIGKTTMGRRLLDEAKKTGRRAAYCDADRDFRFASDDELPLEVANVLASAMGVEVPEVKEAGPLPEARDSSADALVVATLSARIKAVLEALVNGAQGPVLLVVDELGKLRPGFRDAFASAFLALNSEQVQLVFLGNELTATYSSPLAKRLELLWLPDFTAAEAAKAVAFELNEAPAAAAPWNDETRVQAAADGIYAWTEGHAQLTRYWARTLRAQGKDAYSPESLKALADKEAHSRLFAQARAWIEEARAVEELDALLVYWQLLHGQQVHYDEQIAGHRLLRRTGLGAVDEGSMRPRSAIFERALPAPWVEERLRARDLPDALLDGQLLVWLKNARKAGDLPSRAALRRVTQWAKANAASPLLGIEAVRAFAEATQARRRRQVLFAAGVPLAAAFSLLAYWTATTRLENRRVAATQLTEPQLRDQAGGLIDLAREFRRDDSSPVRGQFYQNVEDVTGELLRAWRSSEDALEDLADQFVEVRSELDAALEEPDEVRQLAELRRGVLVALGHTGPPPDDRRIADLVRNLEEERDSAETERDFAQSKLNQILDVLGYTGGGARRRRFNEAVALVQNATSERQASNTAIELALRALGDSGSSAGTRRRQALVTLAQDCAQALRRTRADLTTRTQERDAARSDLVTRTQERDAARSDLTTRTRERDSARRERNAVDAVVTEALQAFGRSVSGSREQRLQEVTNLVRTLGRER